MPPRKAVRDPKRIPQVLATLEALWTAKPDLRLGQLIHNLAGGHPYFVEDDKLVQLVEAELKKARKAS